MKLKRKVLIYFTLIGLCFSLFSNYRVFAEDLSPTPTLSPTPEANTTITPTPTNTQNNEQLKQLNDKIRDLEQKVNDLKKQENSLSSQIDVMDNQIQLTQYRINVVQEQINDTTLDIDSAGKKIKNLEGSLTNVTKVLLSRIVATYQSGEIEPMRILLASSNLQEFLSRENYLKIVQEHDKQLLYNTQQAKVDYANQKSLLESKKKKIVALHSQLDEYNKELDQEKDAKKELLDITKNDEKEYQRRLADALKERQQIQNAAKALITTESRHVNRGEVIGYMGNTGYSFGAHLHFGVYNIGSLNQYDYYSNYESPLNILESQSVYWESGCSGDPSGQVATGTGSFAWPMSTNGLHITQGFGQTCYSNVYYGGKAHPAIDMYNNSNIEVRAAESGEAYFCRKCTSDGANGVFIFHPNGKMTLYWHLQ